MSAPIRWKRLDERQIAPDETHLSEMKRATATNRCRAIWDLQHELRLAPGASDRRTAAAVVGWSRVSTREAKVRNTILLHPFIGSQSITYLPTTCDFHCASLRLLPLLPRSYLAL